MTPGETEPEWMTFMKKQQQGGGAPAAADGGAVIPADREGFSVAHEVP